jgi:hypothetical protein
MGPYMNDIAILTIASLLIGLMLGFPMAFTISWILRWRLESQSKMVTDETEQFAVPAAIIGGKLAARSAI